MKFFYISERESPNKGRSERLRGEGDQIKFIDLGFELGQVVGLSELCWGEATMACTKPQQRKKEEWLRGEKDQIKFIDLGFELGQVVGLSELWD